MNEAKSSTPLQAAVLTALRLSIALLIILWGVDKLANPAHGVAVADYFYHGVLAAATWMPVLGIAEIAIGLLAGLGLFRRFVYPALAVMVGVTLLGVWQSIVDPWGWYFEDSNVLFFPSLIIFAAVCVLIAFREEDTLALDQRRRGSVAPAHEGGYGAKRQGSA